MTRITGIDIDLDRTLPSGDDEIWYTRCPVPTAFEVALDARLFEEEFRDSGLAWRALADSRDPAVHQSHFTHRKANSFRHGGNVPAIYARSRGADTKVIGISWPRTSYPVLALPGSGIKTAADLAGRRLLVPRRAEVAVDFWRASTLRVYETALTSAGLTFDDVELVEIEGESHHMADADTSSLDGRLRWALQDRYSFMRAILLPLVRGDVDAVTAQATIGEQICALTNAQVVFDQADQPDLLSRINNGAPDVLTVSGAFAAEHPDRVARVVTRLLDASNWARAHPDAAIELFARRLQIPTTLLQVTYRDELSQRLDVSLPEHAVTVLQSQQDFLLRHGFIDVSFDVQDWIDPHPIKLAQAAL
jgi:ABC-type nitrate/sulfonate/bicarbonate transport system substrate-binding protein